MMQIAHDCKSTFDGVVIVRRRLPVGVSGERKPTPSSSGRGKDVLDEAFAEKIENDEGDLKFIGGERERVVDIPSKITRSQVSRDIFFEAWRTAMRDYEGKRRWPRPDQNPCQRCRSVRTSCVMRDQAHRTWDPLVCQRCKGAKKQCSINAQFGVETLARGLGLPISWVEHSVRNGWHRSKRHDFRFENYQVRQRFSFDQLLRIEDGEALETVIPTFMAKPRKLFNGGSARSSRHRAVESSGAITTSALDRPPRGLGVVVSEAPLASKGIASSVMGGDPTDPGQLTELDRAGFAASTEDAPHSTGTNPIELSDPDVEVLRPATTEPVISAAPTESSRRLTPNDQDEPMVMDEELVPETLGPVVTALIETSPRLTPKNLREVRDKDDEGISPSTKSVPRSSECEPHPPVGSEHNTTQIPLPLSTTDVLPILSILLRAVPALQTLQSQGDELVRRLEVQSKECRRLNDHLQVSQTNELQTVQRGRLAEQFFAQYGDIDIPALLAKQKLQDENIERVMKENSELTMRILESERVHEELRQALEPKARELKEAELNAVDWRERAVSQRSVVDQLELERLAFRADVFYTQSYLAGLLHRTKLPSEELRRLVKASDALRRALEREAVSPTRLARQNNGSAPRYDYSGQQDRQSSEEIED